MPPEITGGALIGEPSNSDSTGQDLYHMWSRLRPLQRDGTALRFCRDKSYRQHRAT